MKFYAVVLNLGILSANAVVTTDLGLVDLSSSIGKVQPLYKPLRSEDLTATKNVKDHVEWLRPKFPAGSSYVPPLEPYQKPLLQPIPIENGMWLHCFKKFTYRWLQKFVLDTAELRTSINTVNCAISLPEIVGNVDFNAEVVIGILPLTITGHLKATMTGVKVAGVHGSTETLIDGSEVFQVTADKVKLTADKLQLVLSQMCIDTDKDVVMKWWSNLKNDIANVVNGVVIRQINDVMGHYTTKEIRSFLLTP